jgi:large subunit ribosomal protein L13
MAETTTTHKEAAKAATKTEHAGAESAKPAAPRGKPKAVTVIDATGLVLGRMATHVAKRAIAGDEVHIVNAEKAIIVGSSRRAIQEHYLFKRHVGTQRKGPFFPREPHLIVKRTCRGMINYQSSMGRAAYKRIKAHIGVPRELANAKAESVEAARREPRTYLTVAELAHWLGAPRMEA